MEQATTSLEWITTSANKHSPHWGKKGDNNMKYKIKAIKDFEYDSRGVLEPNDEIERIGNVVIINNDMECCIEDIYDELMYYMANGGIEVEEA